MTRRIFYLLVENRPETLTTIVHERLDAENEIDAHREAKQWIENHHNKHVRLLECKMVGEYAYNSVLIPEDAGELTILENCDPK